MRRRTIFLGLAGALLLALPALSQPDDDSDLKAQAAKLAADPALSAEANAAFLANNAKQPGVIKRPSGLQFKILQNGFGKHPGGADTVQVYYTLKLINGQLLDGTSPGLPAFLQVGQVVPGWIEALQLMREGDHWTIWVPANLGYSPAAAVQRGIPPGQTMIFDLRLLSTTPPPKPGEPGCQADPSCAAAAAAQQGQQ